MRVRAFCWYAFALLVLLAIWICNAFLLSWTSNKVLGWVAFAAFVAVLMYFIFKAPKYYEWKCPNGRPRPAVGGERPFKKKWDKRLGRYILTCKKCGFFVVYTKEQLPYVKMLQHPKKEA